MTWKDQTIFDHQTVWNLPIVAAALIMTVPSTSTGSSSHEECDKRRYLLLIWDVLWSHAHVPERKESTLINNCGNLNQASMAWFGWKEIEVFFIGIWRQIQTGQFNGANLFFDHQFGCSINPILRAIDNYNADFLPAMKEQQLSAVAKLKRSCFADPAKMSNLLASDWKINGPSLLKLAKGTFFLLQRASQIGSGWLITTGCRLEWNL